MKENNTYNKIISNNKALLFILSNKEKKASLTSQAKIHET